MAQWTVLTDTIDNNVSLIGKHDIDMRILTFEPDREVIRIVKSEDLLVGRAVIGIETQ